MAVDTRTAQWLREEHLVYQHVDAAYMPGFLGWSDDHSDRPILLLEDLSRADVWIGVLTVVMISSLRTR